MVKRTIISLFSGSGGLDLGFLQTGEFEIVFANDINKDACNTYNRNFGFHCVCEDIREIKDIGHADVIIGGPPCQGFSTANPQRAFDDPRNWLFKEYKRILVSCKPLLFLMENVSGMKNIDGGKVFKLIKSEFQEAGYTINSMVLNAANYGVPQMRKRIIIVGVRNDIQEVYKFPAPVILPPILGQYKTVGDAFRKPFDNNDPNHIVSELSPLNRERIRHIPQGGSMCHCPEYLQNNSDLKRAMRRLELSQPSFTIVHNNCDHYYHPTENRRITIREMARLQNYPDDFVFLGSKSEQSRQVANSVPIQFAYHLALSIVDFLKKIDGETL